MRSLGQKHVAYKLRHFWLVVLFVPVLAHADAGVSARLSGTTLITRDVETSARFFVDVLGFREVGRRSLSAEASRRVFGINDERAVSYIQLVPREWSKDNEYLSGLNLVGIAEPSASTLQQDSDREPINGEVTLAYRVTGIRGIAKKATELGLTIVTPLADSATGKSTTLTVLDPNGLRIHLYEYHE